MAVSRPGDDIMVLIRRSDGTKVRLVRTCDQVYRHSFWYWNLPIDNALSDWKVEIFMKGVKVATHEFVVSSS